MTFHVEHHCNDSSTGYCHAVFNVYSVDSPRFSSLSLLRRCHGKMRPTRFWCPNEVSLSRLPHVCVQQRMLWRKQITITFNEALTDSTNRCFRFLPLNIQQLTLLNTWNLQIAISDVVLIVALVVVEVVVDALDVSRSSERKSTLPKGKVLWYMCVREFQRSRIVFLCKGWEMERPTIYLVSPRRHRER